MDLRELLVKSRFQVVVRPQETTLGLPSGVGSGFMLNYRGRVFFITADHVVHVDDYQRTPFRHGKDYDAYILNNVIRNNHEGNPETMETCLGGLYYFDEGSVDCGGLANFAPVDVAFRELTAEQVGYPYLTPEVNFADGFRVPAGSQKIVFSEDVITDPSDNDMYFVLGKVKFSFIQPDDAAYSVLNYEITLKEGLHYVATNGDFYKLSTEEQKPPRYEEWGGLSGSPVLNGEGQIIGVLCSISTIDNHVFVMNIRKVLQLIDYTIQVNHLEQGNE